MRGFFLARFNTFCRLFIINMARRAHSVCLILIVGLMGAQGSHAETDLNGHPVKLRWKVAGNNFLYDDHVTACMNMAGVFLSVGEPVERTDSKKSTYKTANCTRLVAFSPTTNEIKASCYGVEFATATASDTAGASDPFGCPIRKVENQCAQSGNPIEIGNQAKLQKSIDWRSPKDSRLEIRRGYYSDAAILETPAADLFGGVWATSLAEAITTTGQDKTVWIGSGERYVFGVSGNTYTPLASDDPYSLTFDATAAEFTLSDGSGMTKTFESLDGGVSGRLLSKNWQDGYQQTFAYDATSGLLDSVSDNRDQVLQITWITQPSGTGSFDTVDRIEIDTNYDGIAFAADVGLNYDYTPTDSASDAYNNHLARLSRVDLEDLVASTSRLQWEYTYNPATLPFQLTSIKDGRSNAGSGFNYAEFEYGSDGRATTTKHPNGSSIENQHTISQISTFQREETNPYGLETTYNFGWIEGAYRPVSVTGAATPNCLGTAMAYDYTPNAGAPEGYVYEKTERNGAITRYTRDARGLVLTKSEDATGIVPRVTSYQWHPTLRLPTQRTTTQMQEDFTYNAVGRMLTYTQTDVLVGSPSNGQTRTWTYTYTPLASGLEVLTSVDGPGLVANGVNDVTTYEYFTDGSLKKVTDPNGLITEILTTNAFGQPTLVRQPDGIEWGFSYDIEGRVLNTVFDPNGSAPLTTSYVYDEIGQITSMTNSLGNTWTYTYDNAKRLIETVNPSGDTATYTHDVTGKVTRTEYSDGTNPATFFESANFDELGRLMETIGGANETLFPTATPKTELDYDVEDNLTVITDPLSNTTTNNYDPLNRITDTLDRGNNTTLMEHNDSDLMTRYTDPRSIDTDFAYNGFGEVLTETSADRGTMSYSYNDRGLVTQMVDGRGIVSNYAYDDGGRLLNRNFSSSPGEDVSFEYDRTFNNGADILGLGKIGRVTDESGFTLTRFRANGSPSLERRQIETATYDTRYNFNNEGNLIWIRYPSQQQVNFVYDADNRVTRVQTRMNVIDPQTGQYPPWDVITRNATYYPNGPIKRMVYGDNNIHTAVYDESYRLFRLRDFLGATELRDVRVNHTLRDNVLNTLDLNDNTEDQRYWYTDREKLKKATGPWGDLIYRYDAVGNRTRLISTPLGGTRSDDIYRFTATSNQTLRIDEPSGHQRIFTHDAAGNVTYDNRSGGGYGYTYNAAGRLKELSIDGVLEAEYLYNANGQQVVRRINSTGHTIHSVHDLNGNRIAEYDYDNTTGASTLIREYIWMGATPVAIIEGGAIFYIRTDHIQRPVFATDNTGAQVWEATYLPFGGIHTAAGNNMDLRFPGQWFQSESGLHQNWMRDYDPTIGRYIQADPLGLVDGASVYGYALQNPGRYVDPRGENSKAGRGPISLIPPGYLDDLSKSGQKMGHAVDQAISSIIDQIREMCFPEDEARSCTDHYAACQGTSLGIPDSGSVWGESACKACFDQCRISGDDDWPDFVRGVERCDYWNLPGGQ